MSIDIVHADAPSMKMLTSPCNDLMNYNELLSRCIEEATAAVSSKYHVKIRKIVNLWLKAKKTLLAERHQLSLLSISYIELILTKNIYFLIIILKSEDLKTRHLD